MGQFYSGVDTLRPPSTLASLFFRYRRKVEKFRPFHRKSDPSSPGLVHSSATAQNRFLYAAENCQRWDFAITSISSLSLTSFVNSFETSLLSSMVPPDNTSGDLHRRSHRIHNELRTRKCLTISGATGTLPIHGMKKRVLCSPSDVNISIFCYGYLSCRNAR